MFVFDPLHFVWFAAAVFTVLAGYVAVVVVLVGSEPKELPRYAKPLKPLLSHFLGKPPSTPRVRATSRPNEITLRYSSSATSAWNEDVYEVQTDTEDDRIRDELGAGYLRSYWGPQTSYTIGSLPPNHPLKFRVRCVNQRGKSAWSPAVSKRTTSVPHKCGGAEDGYTWNQTNEHVELSIEVPPETTGRALDIQVRPTSLRVYHKVQRVLVFEGELWGRVRSADLVDFVWELEASGSDSGRVLRIELEKTEVAERREDLWPKAVVEGREFDVKMMMWERAWESGGDWQHVVRTEGGKLSVNDVCLDDYVMNKE